jgi:hypothetical protein
MFHRTPRPAAVVSAALLAIVLSYMGFVSRASAQETFMACPDGTAWAGVQSLQPGWQLFLKFRESTLQRRVVFPSFDDSPPQMLCEYFNDVAQMQYSSEVPDGQSCVLAERQDPRQIGFICRPDTISAPQILQAPQTLTPQPVTPQIIRPIVPPGSGGPVIELRP